MTRKDNFKKTNLEDNMHLKKKNLGHGWKYFILPDTRKFQSKLDHGGFDFFGLKKIAEHIHCCIWVILDLQQFI